MTCRFDLATDDQLITIIKHDREIPTPLLRGVVIEMLDRGMFDDMFADCAYKVTGNIEKFEQRHKIGLDDLAQVGRLAILDAAERFDATRGASFFTFAYMKVKRKMIREVEPLNAQKRDASKVVSYHDKTVKGTDFEIFLVDREKNVEKYVMDKVMVEQLLDQVNDHQKRVLLYRMQGYEFKEIASLLGRGSDRSMSQAYRLAVKKIRGRIA